MKEHTLIWSAIHELKIDVPVMRYEIKGDTITLHLYGGQVVKWSPKPEHPVSPSPAKKSRGRSKSLGGTPHGDTPQ
jgi:hypothetical protein